MTAVEWLDNEQWKIRLKLRGSEISIGLYIEQEIKLIEQAKQMEKEQIKEAFQRGIVNKTEQNISSYYSSKKFHKKYF